MVEVAVEVVTSGGVSVRQGGYGLAVAACGFLASGVWAISNGIGWGTVEGLGPLE